MDLGLGLNLNNLTGLQGAKAAATTPMASAETASAPASFKNQLSATNADSKSFNGKPIDLPLQESSPVMGPPSLVSMDRLIQPSVDVAQGPKIAPTVQVDSLTHRVAWQRFLQKMKSELGVSAEDILKAFQQLSQEELAQPPEKNVDKLVSLLGLNPEQSQIASQLFVDLIRKTGSKPLAQELKSSNREINLTVMSQREQEQKRLNQTLSRMNDQFFMKETLQSGKEVSPELLAKMQPVNEAEGKEILKQLSQQALNRSETVAVKEDPQASAPVSTSASAGSSSRLMAALSASAALQTGSQVESSGEMQKGSQKESQKDTLAQILERSVSGDAVDAESQIPSDQKVTAKTSAESKHSFARHEESANATNLVPENLSEAVIDRAAFRSNMDLSAAGAGVALQSRDAVTPEDLIQKAQLMVRDGGGDVKMILQPEGLGEVAMKVKVNGDKVSVEMITESDVAKKMIEKGMSDLKAHLHASNLNLESLKINTASQLGHQLEQQYQDAQRQQAHQFMQQFNQGNQNFRRGFFEMPGARVYQSQTKARGSQVEGVEAPRKKEGSRLNLVA